MRLQTAWYHGLCIVPNFVCLRSTLSSYSFDYFVCLLFHFHLRSHSFRLVSAFGVSGVLLRLFSLRSRVARPLSRAIGVYWRSSAVALSLVCFRLLVLYRLLRTVPTAGANYGTDSYSKLRQQQQQQ